MPPLLAIFAWPVVAAILFGKLRKPLAVLVTLLAGFLLLPERTEIDLPLLPPIDKETVPVLMALVLGALVAPRPGDSPVLPGYLPDSWIAKLLLLMLLVGAFATTMTNGDALWYGAFGIPGLRSYDAFSAILSSVIALLPALLARKYLSGPDGHRLILVVLSVAALGYSLLALIEVRLSPQMNNWVYGFFPHSWLQHVRSGGFRPLVFVSHGLVLAIFFCMAILAATGLWRIDRSRSTTWLLAAGWLLMTLLLSNSLGALVIAFLMVPVVAFLSVRAQILAAAAVAVTFLTYPVLRGADLVPVDRIASAASRISEERAGSLQYRFDNEDILLEKASDRPIFGWGGWGRSRVYDEETGRDISVTDGYWVIVIGTGGWVGYIAEFGLLGVPILLLLRRSRQLEVGRETAILSVILAANLIDLLPNSSTMPLTWIVAGALWGRLEHAPEVAADAGREEAAAGPAARPGYRRPGLVRSPDPAPRPAVASDRPATAYTRQNVRIVRPGSALRR